MSNNRVLACCMAFLITIFFVAVSVSCASPEKGEDCLTASDIDLSRYHSFFTTESSSVFKSYVNLFGITEDGNMEPVHLYTKKGNEYVVASIQVVDGRYIALLVFPKEKESIGSTGISIVNGVREIFTQFFLIDAVMGTVLDVSSVIPNFFTSDCIVCKTNDEFIFQSGYIGELTYYAYNPSDSSVRQINNPGSDGSFEDYAISCDGHLLISGFQWNRLYAKYYPNTGEAPISYTNHDFTSGLRYHHTSLVGSGSATFLFNAESKTKYVFTSDGIVKENYEYEEPLVGRYVHYFIPKDSNPVLYYSAMEGRTVNYIEKSNEIVIVEVSGGSIDIQRYKLPEESALSKDDSALILGKHLVVKSGSTLYQVDLETGNRTVINSRTISLWNTFDSGHLIITETNGNNQESYLWDLETHQKTLTGLFQEQIIGCFFVEGTCK